MSTEESTQGILNMFPGVKSLNIESGEGIGAPTETFCLSPSPELFPPGLAILRI
jgi:hypothetical protein